MTKEKDNLWLAVKILLGLPLLFYALLSVLEPQREIWRKPTKKVLVAFLIAWGAVVCFVVLVSFGTLTGRKPTLPMTALGRSRPAADESLC